MFIYFFYQSIFSDVKYFLVTVCINLHFLADDINAHDTRLKFVLSSLYSQTYACLSENICYTGN